MWLYFCSNGSNFLELRFGKIVLIKWMPIYISQSLCILSNIWFGAMLARACAMQHKQNLVALKRGVIIDILCTLTLVACVSCRS